MQFLNIVKNFIYGKKEEEKDLKESIFQIEEKEKNLLNQIDALKNEAKENVKLGNKEKALELLRRKKAKENEYKKIANAKQTLTTVESAIEDQKMYKDLSVILNKSKKELERSMRDINQDQIQDMFDDIEELVEKSDEISETFSRPLKKYDDDELLKELEDLEKDQDFEDLQNLQELEKLNLEHLQDLQELRELEDLEKDTVLEESRNSQKKKVPDNIGKKSKIIKV